MATTTIDTQATLTTLINVFTVEPGRQRELVDLLTEATEKTMQHQPGFISANIHAGADGARVVNYAQWESADAYRTMLTNPVCQEHMKAALDIAEADPHLCTVESVHHV